MRNKVEIFFFIHEIRILMRILILLNTSIRQLIHIKWVIVLLVSTRSLKSLFMKLKMMTFGQRSFTIMQKL